jgi:hypothetical protein
MHASVCCTDFRAESASEVNPWMISAALMAETFCTVRPDAYVESF